MPLSRGQRLLRLREQKGVDQKDVAAAVGISRPYVSRLETDAKGRNLDHMRSTLERIAGYFGVLPEYLLLDEPQTYIRAWINQGVKAAPSSFGGRLRLVLDELRMRWGGDFGPEWLAAEVGSTPSVIQAYLTDELTVTSGVIEHIAALTGAPVSWLLDGAADEADSHHEAAGRFEEVLARAIENGMQPDDLSLLVDAWIAGRNAKKPSG